jgi:hypothetical protein
MNIYSFQRLYTKHPIRRGYIHLADEIERTLPIKPKSKAKKGLIAKCKEFCAKLNDLDDVVSAHVLDAFVIPPGNKPGRKFLEKIILMSILLLMTW